MTAEVRPARRLIVLVGAVILSASAVATRLVVLQARDTEAYRARAREQHEGQVRIEGRRGTIWDRNGRELAVSIETKSVYVHPERIASVADRERLIGGVASALGSAPSEIRSLIDDPRNRKFVFLRRRLSPRETSALQELHLPARDARVRVRAGEHRSRRDSEARDAARRRARA